MPKCTNNTFDVQKFCFLKPFLAHCSFIYNHAAICSTLTKKNGNAFREFKNSEILFFARNFENGSLWESFMPMLHKTKD